MKGTIFKNNNHNSWSEVSEVNSDEATSEMATATSESINETTSEMVTATSESTNETTSEMVTATSESTSEATSEMTPSSGCDISIPSKVMDFCRINESVPCDEVWHHVDPKCYAIGGVAVVAMVMVLMLVMVVICCLCHCTRLHSCCHYKRCCCCCHSKRCRHCRSLLQYQHIIKETDGSVEGGRVSVECRRMSDCLRGKKTPPPEYNDGVDRADDRRKEEKEEKVDQSQAEENFHGFFSKFNYKEEVENTQISFLGCRLQKYWYRGLKDESPILVTQAPISRKCLFELDTKTDLMFEILKKIGQHPHIHPIWDLKIFRDHVFIVLHLRKEGSLRDKLNKSPDPTLDWGGKYGTDSYKTPLEKTLIYQYGRELSETFLYLYKLGFPPLGNVHTGNIFITEEGIELGGYENVLLGYRTRLYRDIAQEDCLRQIDGIMFGHVIFEMACGFEPGHVFPTDEDYQKVEDEEVRKVLTRIFTISKKESNYKDLMKKIGDIGPFKNHHSKLHRFGVSVLTSDEKKLLKTVKESIIGKSRSKRLLTRFQRRQEPETECWEIHQPDNYSAALEAFTEVETRTEISAVIGQRSEKIWTMVNDDCLQTITEVPETCPIYIGVSFQALSDLAKILSECHYIFPIKKCQYKKVNRHHLISMVYPYQKKGSLRDLIYEMEPRASWEEKEAKIKGGRSQPLTPKQISSFGHQILTAMEYLHELGFPPLQHVHTGNIFVEGDVCRLGGYENTLLGYKVLSSPVSKYIDVIMFGRVLYEMICGEELHTTKLEKENYQAIPDHHLKGILQYVFSQERNGNFSHTISQILDHKFFRSPSSLPELPAQTLVQQSALPNRIEYVLMKVQKGKPRNQDDTLNEFKTRGQETMGRAISWMKTSLKISS